eukprot:6452862-Amphidinium_carterae.1
MLCTCYSWHCVVKFGNSRIDSWSEAHTIVHCMLPCYSPNNNYYNNNFKNKCPEHHRAVTALRNASPHPIPSGVGKTNACASRWR